MAPAQAAGPGKKGRKTVVCVRVTANFMLESASNRIASDLTELRDETDH